MLRGREIALKDMPCITFKEYPQPREPLLIRVVTELVIPWSAMFRDNT